MRCVLFEYFHSVLFVSRSNQCRSMEWISSYFTMESATFYTSRIRCENFCSCVYRKVRCTFATRFWRVTNGRRKESGRGGILECSKNQVTNFIYAYGLLLFFFLASIRLVYMRSAISHYFHHEQHTPIHLYSNDDVILLKRQFTSR